MAVKCLGVDIGSSSIKIVEIQPTNKGFHVSRFVEHPLNIAPGADQDLEVIEFLRQFSSSYDPSQTRFVFGLRQDRVAFRNKFFPFSDRIKISKSLAFELEEDIPFSSENAIFDAKIIRTVGGGADVLVAAVPKHHVENAIQKAKDAGMDPFLISADGTAFANIFEKWNDPPPKNEAPTIGLEDLTIPTEKKHLQLYLNIGHTRTLVCAFEGNSLVAARSILWGGKNIAEAITKKYDIPFLDAIKELKTKAFILTNKEGATFDQLTFSDTIAKSVREMTRDLQLTMLELKTEFNALVDNIGVTGGVSQIQNLGAFLTQTLEVPVNLISILDKNPEITFDSSIETGVSAGIALGLALDGLKKPRNPALNFMRGEFLKQNHQLKKFWEKWGHTSKVAGALVLTLFIYSNFRESLSLNLADRTQEVLIEQGKSVAGLKGKKATESGIKKYILQNKKRAADLKLLANVTNMNSALDILKKVSDSTPSKTGFALDVYRFQVDDSDLLIEGYLASPKEVTRLQQSLTNVASDGKIKVLNSNLEEKPGKVSFSFSLNIDRGIQKVTR